MKGYRIVFIRHGMTQGNEEGRYIGTTDIPLSEKGSKDLFEKHEKYHGFKPQKIYTSPLKRCKQTASILFPDSYAVELNELREMDFGIFENKKVEDLVDDPDYKQFIKGGLDNPPPQGESAREMVSRCYEAIKILISDMMYEGITNAAVITHSGIIMNMLGCFGLPKRSPMEYVCDFGEGFEVMVTADMWQRSEAFEVMGRVPYEEVPAGEADDYDDRDREDEEED